MKKLRDQINESINISLGQVSVVNEAWGTESTRYFKRELEKIFADYDKADKSRKNKLAKNKPLNERPGKGPAEKLAKYPMQILIDNAGYTPKELVKWSYRKGEKETVIDNEAYGEFILQQLEDGKFTKDDLIKWWEEYSNKINQAKWHDIKFLAKQIDPTRCWNPYYPKDDSVITAMLNEPARLVSYLKPGNNLTYSEREELRAFLADPVNIEDAKKAIKGVKNSIMKARPTFATGVENHIKSLIEYCEYNGKKGSLLDILKDEYKANHNRRYYQGSNDSSCEGTAIVGLILKVINQLYGFEVWHSMYMNDNDDSYWADVEQKANIKGDVSDETLEGFLDDADHLKFIITDKGSSKDGSKTSSVHASSFSTYYNHDFEVICKKDDEEIFHETFTDITVASTFYSGGWD